MRLLATKPIATCSADDCAGCQVGEAVQCHFRLRDHVLLTLIWMPSILIGGAGVLATGLAPLIGWGIFMALFFGLVETRVLCSHCPHYQEPGPVLRCWANRGGLKLWAPRPGPMSLIERWVFLVGLAAVWLFPLVLLVGGRRWLLLALFVFTTAGFFIALKLPLNGVGDETREAFLARNPGMARAWAAAGAHPDQPAPPEATDDR